MDVNKVVATTVFMLSLQWAGVCRRQFFTFAELWQVLRIGLSWSQNPATVWLQYIWNQRIVVTCEIHPIFLSEMDGICNAKCVANFFNRCRFTDLRIIECLISISACRVMDILWWCFLYSIWRHCLCHMRLVMYSASLHSSYAGYLADHYSNL